MVDKIAIEKNLLCCKRMLEDRGLTVVGIFLYGSQNYNLDYEGSDIDLKAIVIPNINDIVFNKTNGIDSFNYICKFHYVEIACAYCFNRKFWINNKFKFLDKAYHEDFGLIPLVLIKSLSTKSIDYIGYNYYQRSNSISKSSQYDKVLKKANDFLKHFVFLKSEGFKCLGNLSIFNSYISSIYNNMIIISYSLFN